MKTINLHGTQTKKTYRKPELKKMGDVLKITRATKGGSLVDFENDPVTSDYAGG
jgi:hypothetical protein